MATTFFYAPTFQEEEVFPSGSGYSIVPGKVVDTETVAWDYCDGVQVRKYDRTLERLVIVCTMGDVGQPGWTSKTREQVEADYPGSLEGVP